MSYHYNNRLTVEGRLVDVVDFTLRVAGKEPVQCRTQTSPPPVKQALTLSCLVKPPLKKDRNVISGIREWMAVEWGCTSYAYDLHCELFDFCEEVGTPVRAVYTFKTQGAPPQVWILKISREYPRIRFTLEYDQNLGLSRYNGPAGRMVYQDGRYLEALIQNHNISGNRDTVRAVRFGPDAERVGAVR